MFATPTIDLLWLLATLLFFVLVLVLVDHGAERLRLELRRWRASRQQPGTTALRPLRIASFDETRSPTAAVCGCGERLERVFEGPTPSRRLLLWLVIQACPVCHQQTRTYFDVTGVDGQGSTISAQPLTPAPR